MGFKDQIRDAYNRGQGQQLLEKYLKALHEARSHLDDKRARDAQGEAFWRVKLFTDNIVLGIPVVDDSEIDLGLAFSLVGLFQHKLVQHGFFVRGGIAVGDFYMDEDVVFGEALLEAHDAESRLARDPRIVLAVSALRHVQEHLCYYAAIQDTPHEHELLFDADDQVFVDYLMAPLDGTPPDPAYFDSLKNHKTTIEENLQRFRREPRVWSKYAWAANYHNSVCAQLQLEYGEYGVDAAHLQPHPRKLHMVYQKEPGRLLRLDSGVEVARRRDLDPVAPSMPNSIDATSA